MTFVDCDKDCLNVMKTRIARIILFDSITSDNRTLLLNAQFLSLLAFFFSLTVTLSSELLAIQLMTSLIEGFFCNNVLFLFDMRLATRFSDLIFQQVKPN